MVLAFSSCIGSSDDDFCNSITVDDSGAIYIAGETKSSDFPTYNAFQSTLNISYFPDIFVSKITADGSSFVYSTYLGGTSGDGVWDCFVNEEGQLTIVGQTSSSDFPTSNGSFQSNKPYATNRSDGIVTRFDTSGNLVFSTFLGGEDGNTSCYNVMDGSNDSIFVSGTTGSNSFPTLYEIFKDWNFIHCSFVTELQSDGSAINFSSTFPGISKPFDMEVDNSGAIYLIGDKGFMDGYHGFQLTSNGNREGYTAKLVPSSNPYMTVTSPNGGEAWGAGSSQMITWTSDGPMTDVMIDYSIDGGNSWKTITQSTTNDGNYNWYVPSTSSTQCLVRIRENDGDSGLSDTSDSVFSIN